MCILMPAWFVSISHVQHARPEDRTCVCTSRCGLSTTPVGSSMIWLTCNMCTHLCCWTCFLFLANFGVLVQLRIPGKQRRPSSTSSYQRPRGTWRMFLDTNKLFPSAGFVVGLAALLKLSHGSLMDRDGGQWSQSRFCLACWRMRRAMLRYCLCCPEYFLFIVHNCGAWYDFHYLPSHCLLSFWVGEKVYTQPVIVLCWANCSADKFLAAGERPWCRHPLHLSHSGQQGTKTAAPDIPCTWENQPYVLSQPSFVELVLLQGDIFWVIVYLLVDLAGSEFHNSGLLLRPHRFCGRDPSWLQFGSFGWSKWYWWCFWYFTAYMSSPCHIELTLSEKEVAVKKEVRVLTCFHLHRSYHLRTLESIVLFNCNQRFDMVGSYCTCTLCLVGQVLLHFWNNTSIMLNAACRLKHK